MVRWFNYIKFKGGKERRMTPWIMLGIILILDMTNLRAFCNTVSCSDLRLMRLIGHVRALSGTQLTSRV